jgi:hypothetical protein
MWRQGTGRLSSSYTAPFLTTLYTSPYLSGYDYLPTE